MPVCKIRKTDILTLPQLRHVSIIKGIPMANRITPEAQLMIGIFEFAKNIVTIALGIVLGGYLILRIAEYRAHDMLMQFRANLQSSTPHKPPAGIRPMPMK